MKAQNIPESSLQVFDDVLMEALYENDNEISKLLKKLSIDEVAELCMACTRIIEIAVKDFTSTGKAI